MQEITSHYFACVVKSSFEEVFEAISRNFGNVYSKSVGEANKSRIGIALDEQFFFRVSSDVAVLVVLRETPSRETEVEVVSCAGGKGIFSISYAAHKDYVHEVRDFLVNSGFKIESEKEMSYFSNHSRGE